MSPEYSLEGLMLKLKLQHFSSFEKTLILGKIEGGRRRRLQRMRWFNGIIDSVDIEVGDGQGGLEYCSPWGRKESDTTELLN